MMRSFCATLFTVLTLSVPLIAAEIYVEPGGTGMGTKDRPTNLRTALETAARNTESDTIYLRRGTYDASRETFFYRSPADTKASVTLSGGWDNAFAERGNHPTLTRLVGGGTNRVFRISALLAAQDFEFTLEFLSIENGYVNADEGGGLMARNWSGGRIRLTIRECWFTGNVAVGGAGGALSTNGPVLVEDSRFSSNRARSGGALAIRDVPGGNKSLSQNIVGSTFANNSGSTGGAGCAILNEVSLAIRRSSFRGSSDGASSSGPGGTIYSGPGTSLSIEASSFIGCRTDNSGSAVRIRDAVVIVTSTLFADCVAGQSSIGGRGAVDILNTSARSAVFTNCTFARCSSATDIGGALHVQGVVAAVTNSIFWQCGSMSFNNFSPALNPTAGFCYSDVTFVSGSVVGVGGNQENAVVDPFLSTGGHHLSAASPCLDAGDNNAPGLPGVDGDGQGRVVDGDGDETATVDIGAYERQANVEVGSPFLDFGRLPVDWSTLLPVSIVNSGTAILDLGKFAITGPDAGEFLIESAPCSGGTLAPAGSCLIQLAFKPTTEGAKTATLEIPSDDPDTPVLPVPLLGEGVSKPRIFPAEGTLGSVLTIFHMGFGDLRGKVGLALPGTTGKMKKLKVIEWSDNLIRVLVKKKMAPGAYDLLVRKNGAQGRPPLAIPGFDYRAPRIDTVSAVAGFPGDAITVNGAFFGYKKVKAKLFFEYRDTKGKLRRKRMKAPKKTFVWNPESGVSGLTAIVPKVPAAAGRIVMKSAFGETVVADPFAVN